MRIHRVKIRQGILYEQENVMKMTFCLIQKVKTDRTIPNKNLDVIIRDNE